MPARLQVFAEFGNLAHITKHASAAYRLHLFELFLTRRNMRKDDGLAAQLCKSLARHVKLLNKAITDRDIAARAYRDRAGLTGEYADPDFTAEHLPLDEYLASMRSSLPRGRPCRM